MKRHGFLYLILAVMVFSAFINSASGQVRRASERVKFFNNGDLTLRNCAILQWDSTWQMLFDAALDTTKRVWLHDTSGRAQYGFGRGSKYWKGADHGDSIKGKFTDTLYSKKGQAHYIKIISHTAVSADTIVLFGRRLIDPFTSLTADSACVDSITPAVGAGKISPNVWTILDSLQIRTSPAGTDCVRVLYRPYLSSILADSNDADIAGVLVGRSLFKAPAANDTVAADSFGYMAISGDVEAYLSGERDSRSISIGDYLTVGNGGKAILAYTPKQDTIKTSALRNVRYVQGARPNDIVLITQTRYSTSTTADSAQVRANCPNPKDSIAVIFIGVAASSTLGRDSLVYQWIPRGYLNKWPQVIVGTALEPVWTDSTKAWIRLKER
jgi:hypothetical protein